ncbi:siderophore-interacting protein [Mycobacterium sp. Y57]|uniref:siderophore-interacting protein n=1 Tax=Mycolicibacterium xanthum TaxID=2796469 RepID=UPI001C863DD7|nr:siderophore-interacting protein [Mycolicibacterium xanthum]MBX7433148.1 siderophore-interacting protein [Mycolicibacterium xanthum]
MPFTLAGVVGTVALGPRMQRIEVEAEDPGTLAVPVAADAAVGVYFGGGDPSGTDARTYSVRHHDGARLTLDVVLHTHGPGTGWASTARPGQRVGLDHARSWYRPPPETRWQLLVGDLAGLPACARILDELPADVPVTLVVEVPDDADLDYLPGHPNLTIVAATGTGNGLGPSRLGGLVAGLALPDGPGYCWLGAEATQSRAVRKHLRALGWTTDRYDVTGYWRHDSERWDARFAQVSGDALAVYQRALADGKGDKLALEEFDEALERVGL